MSHVSSPLSDSRESLFSTQLDDITAIGIHEPSSHVLIGTESGRVWVFIMDSVSFIPQVLLVGHRHPITCFSFTIQDTDVPSAGDELVLVSASQDGEVCLWNLCDGQCLNVNHTAFPGVPRSMAVSECSQFIFIGGQSSQFLVIDAQTLEPISSTIDLNDWVSQVECLSTTDSKIFLSVLTPTAVCQFAFDIHSYALSKLFHHSISDPSLLIDPTIVSMTSNQSQTAFISKRTVMLYEWSIGKVQAYSSISIPQGEVDWVGGKFCNHNKLILWSRINNVFVYDFSVSISAFQYKFPLSFTSTTFIDVLGSRLIACSGETMQVYTLDNPSDQAPIPTISIRDFGRDSIQRQMKDQVTCQVLLPGNRSLVRGTNSGRLQICTLSHMFGSPELDVQAHDGPVTCILVHQVAISSSDVSVSSMHKSTAPTTPDSTMIISGGSDCTLRIFYPQDLSASHILRCHVVPITRILAVPTGSPVPDSFVSVAADHSIGIIRLVPQEVNGCNEYIPQVVYWIPNGPATPIELAWRDDLVLVGYNHQAGVHVWDTRSGSLDRIVHGETARTVLFGCYPRLPLAGRPVGGDAFQRSALSEVNMDASHVFMVNLKRVVANEEVGIAYSLATALITVGIESSMDSLVTGVDHNRVTLGIRGTNGYLALMAPHHQEGLSISPTVTATRLLAMYLITRSLMLKKDPSQSESDFQTAFIKYLDGLANLAGLKMKHASLAFLARYWHDSLPTLQYGARLLFKWTLVKLPSDRIAAIVRYWSEHLPITDNAPIMLSKTMSRATTILAVMACENPNQIPLAVIKLIANALTRVIAEIGTTDDHQSASSLTVLTGSGRMGNGSDIYRLSVIELIGRGFPTWEPHVSSAYIVRQLIVIGTQTVASQPTTKPTTAGQPGNLTGPLPTIPQGPGQAISSMARQALLAIAGYSMSTVVNTVITDLEHGGTSTHLSSYSQTTNPASASAVTVDKVMLLRFITYLVHKMAPVLAHSGIGVRLAEAVVQVLDPAHAHHQRDALLQPATGTLFEMVRRFSTVAFHAGAQKLATGHLDGRVVVWDVKTATRAYIIDAHLTSTTGVSALAFAQDGKSLVSYSRGDSSIKVWSPPSGIAFLMGAVSGNNALKATKIISHVPIPPSPTRQNQSGTQSTWVIQLLVVDNVIELIEDGKGSCYRF